MKFCSVMAVNGATIVVLAWDALRCCKPLVPLCNMILPPSPLQNAGNQLKSLQKALKNPISNAGLLAGELSKRAKRLHHTLTLCILLSVRQEVVNGYIWWWECTQYVMDVILRLQLSPEQKLLVLLILERSTDMIYDVHVDFLYSRVIKVKQWGEGWVGV